METNDNGYQHKSSLCLQPAYTGLNSVVPGSVDCSLLLSTCPSASCNYFPAAYTGVNSVVPGMFVLLLFLAFLAFVLLSSRSTKQCWLLYDLNNHIFMNMRYGRICVDLAWIVSDWYTHVPFTIETAVYFFEEGGRSSAIHYQQKRKVLFFRKPGYFTIETAVQYAPICGYALNFIVNFTYPKSQCYYRIKFFLLIK